MTSSKPDVSRTNGYLHPGQVLQDNMTGTCTQGFSHAYWTLTS